MKILVNATTLVIGGGVQVGASFIEYVVNNSMPEKMDFQFAVSAQVLRNLPGEIKSDKRINLVSPSPARPFAGISARAFLAKLENEFGPHLIYSIGAPSYVQFRTPELARFTDPWGTHASNLAWQALPIRERVIIWLTEHYKMLWLRKADYFETQSAPAAEGLAARLSLSPDRIRVIPNAVSFAFGDSNGRRGKPGAEEVTRVLTLSAPYRHKNLPIIPSIALLLKKLGFGDRYRFVVTLPDDGDVVRGFWSHAKRCGVEDMILNVGQVKLADCVGLYQDCDVVLMPTLLETFSVTYLEAMAMGKPIVTTDLGFAHDVCGEAAAYYSPLSAQSAVEAICKVMGDEAYRSTLISSGRLRLAEFPSPDEKYRLALDWIREVAERRVA